MFAIEVQWECREIEEATVATQCPDIVKFALEFGNHHAGWQEKGCYHFSILNGGHVSTMAFVTPKFETALSLSRQAVEIIKMLGRTRYTLKAQPKRILTRADGPGDQLQNLGLLLETLDSTQEKLAKTISDRKQLVQIIADAASFIKGTRSLTVENIGPRLQAIRLDLERFAEKFK